MRPSGHRFRAAQLLERDGSNRSQAPIALATHGQPRRRVAWTGFDGANSRVRVASTDPSARFGAPQDVSPAGRDGVVSDLAGRERDPARRLGQRQLRRQPGLRRARPARRALRRAPRPSPRAQEARAGTAIMVPAPTVVWTNRPAGSHPPGGMAAVQTFAQAATRTG